MKTPSSFGALLAAATACHANQSRRIAEKPEALAAATTCSQTDQGQQAQSCRGGLGNKDRLIRSNKTIPCPRRCAGCHLRST